jgi:hypothetical protein
MWRRQRADGRKVTNLDQYPFVPEDLPPDQPVLVEGGGVGSEGGRLGRGAFWDLDWPGHNVVPGMAPVAAVLARTEQTIVALTGIRAYPTGFGFTLNLRLRNLHPRQRRGFWPFPELGRHRGPPWSDEGVAVDGRVRRWPLGHEPRSGPQRSRGAGVRAADAEQRAGDRRGSRRLELRHGLPAPAPASTRAARLRLRVAGPRHPIGAGRGRRAAVLRAADAAVTLWSDDPYCSAD